MNFNERIASAQTIYGWFTKSDMAVIDALLKEVYNRANKPLNVLEIGTYKGRSTVFLLLSLPPNSQLTYVDIFEDCNDHGENGIIKGKLTGGQLERICKNNITKTQRFANRTDVQVTHVRADSKVWLKENRNKFKKLFNFIFIDGDHRYEGVKADLLNSLPLIKDDGIIAGHDFGISGPEVTKFVIDELGEYAERIEPQVEDNSTTSVWFIDSKLNELKRKLCEDNEQHSTAT